MILTSLLTLLDSVGENETPESGAAGGVKLKTSDDDDDDDEGCSSCSMADGCFVSSCSRCDDCNTDQKLPVKLSFSVVSYVVYACLSVASRQKGKGQLSLSK